MNQNYRVPRKGRCGAVEPVQVSTEPDRHQGFGQEGFVLIFDEYVLGKTSLGWYLRYSYDHESD